MSKKRRLAVFCILSLALPLILVSWAWAAPNLVGTWGGIAPVITVNGCSTEAVSVTIAKQCTNLFSGTMPLAGHSIPVVGRYYPGYWDRLTQWNLAEPYYASLLFFLDLHLRDLCPGDHAEP